ncbi:MAG: hypothetical protein A2580_16070 [Hydrogenophilales bacterium RIFOXYD1_FULL_62_11]|nr:MAG: hypothetical protein A2580_16070 [Hydrogenophilales bacterium RIFOXYD1_FULL_62_11]
MDTVITVNLSPEILFETENVLVRRMSLAPYEIAPLHFHTQVHEYIVCLNGKIAVAVKNDNFEAVLLPGQSINIPPAKSHQIKNMIDSVSQYLLTQSGGTYDFCDAPA